MTCSPRPRGWRLTAEATTPSSRRMRNRQCAFPASQSWKRAKACLHELRIHLDPDSGKISLLHCLDCHRGFLPNHEFAASFNNFVQVVFGLAVIVIRYDLPGIATGCV